MKACVLLLAAESFVLLPLQGIQGEAGRRGGHGEFPRPQFPWPNATAILRKTWTMAVQTNTVIRGPSPECWPTGAWQPLRTELDNGVDATGLIRGEVTCGRDPMNYGVHSEAVQEVLDFAKAGPILQPLGKPPAGIPLVRDFGLAQRMAWEDHYGEDELLWTDIREREMSVVKGKAYTIPGFTEVKENLTSSLKLLTAWLKRKLDESYVVILDDIIADLFNCACARAVDGTSNPFFERLFTIYKAGAWPCGWSGQYPQGHIVAYWPRQD